MSGKTVRAVVGLLLILDGALAIFSGGMILFAVLGFASAVYGLLNILYVRYEFGFLKDEKKFITTSYWFFWVIFGGLLALGRGWFLALILGIIAGIFLGRHLAKERAGSL